MRLETVGKLTTGVPTHVDDELRCQRQLPSIR